jgi:hypothetical protein
MIIRWLLVDKMMITDNNMIRWWLKDDNNMIRWWLKDDHNKIARQIQEVL